MLQTNTLLITPQTKIYTYAPCSTWCVCLGQDDVICFHALQETFSLFPFTKKNKCHASLCEAVGTLSIHCYLSYTEKDKEEMNGYTGEKHTFDLVFRLNPYKFFMMDLIKKIDTYFFRIQFLTNFKMVHKINQKIKTVKTNVAL